MMMPETPGLTLPPSPQLVNIPLPESLGLSGFQLHNRSLLLSWISPSQKLSPENQNNLSVPLTEQDS